MSDTNDIETGDQDVPAIAPPEVEQGSAPSADADADDGPVYRRSIGENTRKLFAQAAKSIGEQIAEGDTDDEVPAIGTSNEPPAAAAAPSTPAQPGSQPAAAAAPAIDAATNRRGLELDVRAKSLDEREATLAEREASVSRYADARDRYAEKPFELLKELVKEWSGASTDEELRDEFADLVTMFSERGLGMQVSDDVKNRTEARRTLRVAKSYTERAKRDAEAAQKRAAEVQTAAEQQRREATAIDGLTKTLAMDEHAKKYPHLMLEDEPGAIVWDVIKHQQLAHIKAGNAAETFVANWATAAELADNHFRAQHDKQRQKLNRLPTPTAQAPASGASNQGAAQGRAARTLTNATATPVPPAQPVDDDEPYDRDKARRRSLGRLKSELEKRTTT